MIWRRILSVWINYSNYYLLDPLEDEILSSIVTRTALLLNDKHRDEIACHFFNHHHRKAASVIPVNNFKDPMTIFDHCIGSYYMASFKLKRQKILLNNIFFFDNSKFVGIFKNGTNSSVFRKETLFYCPCCIKDDLDRFGFPYFHLSHQYEGVNACAKHGTKLLAFDSKYKAFPILKLNDYRDPVEANLRDILYSNWALNFHNFSHEYLNMIYQTKIFEKDLGLLNKQNLYKQLEEYFGFDFMFQWNCSKEQLRAGNEKILDLLKPKGRPAHPFYHFMLWEFLGLCPDDFKESVFALKGKKILPIPKPEDPSELSLIEEDLGKKKYFSEKLGKEVIEYFPIDIKSYIKNH